MALAEAAAALRAARAASSAAKRDTAHSSALRVAVAVEDAEALAVAAAVLRAAAAASASRSRTPDHASSEPSADSLTKSAKRCL